MRSRDKTDARPEVQQDRLTVRIALNRRGAWEVGISDQSDPVTCETLDDARRVAYLCAAHTRPCELIVRDVYHHVLQHEFIDGHRRRTSVDGAANRGADE